MELTGKIIAVLDEKSGVSEKTGNKWRCAQYVIESIEPTPRRMLFEVFGDGSIDYMNIKLGELLTVQFDVDAREYNGRWYNKIRVWRVDRELPSNVIAPMPPSPFACQLPLGGDPHPKLPF